jgi:hypothetical protein
MIPLLKLLQLKVNLSFIREAHYPCSLRRYIPFANTHPEEILDREIKVVY